MTPLTQQQPKKRSIWRWILVAALALILIGAAGFVIWASNPLGPAPEALAALQSDEQVQVEQGDWLVFRPTSSEPSDGLIIYPGGRVDYRSYAPVARGIAAQGYLVVIPPMRLNLAVFSPDRASDVINDYPEIENWTISGHSLGGTMAASYALQHPQTISGLVLWASYPAGNNSLAQANLAVASISASEDGLATPADIEASRPLLPSTTKWTEIMGGNHAQFGAYGTQPGDGQATISQQEQHSQIIEATVDLMSSQQLD